MGKSGELRMQILSLHTLPLSARTVCFPTSICTVRSVKCQQNPFRIYYYFFQLFPGNTLVKPDSRSDLNLYNCLFNNHSEGSPRESPWSPKPPGLPFATAQPAPSFEDPDWGQPGPGSPTWGPGRRLVVGVSRRSAAGGSWFSVR